MSEFSVAASDSTFVSWAKEKTEIRKKEIKFRLKANQSVYMEPFKIFMPLKYWGNVPFLSVE